MKVEEKNKAIELRQQGLAINNIAKQVGVSKSTVSLWVRDVILTEEQLEVLHNQNPIYNRLLDSAKNIRENAQKLREQYQEIGRNKAREQDPLYIAGCMLYWGEGSKSRYALQITNSDPDMLVFYLHWLKQSFDVPLDKIRIVIHCYDDINSISEIEKYWQETLKLPIDNFNKTTINKVSVYSQNKKCGKSPYGTCRITVGNVKLVQQVYGSIQEFAKFNNTNWVK